jgi:hypothetical protein
VDDGKPNRQFTQTIEEDIRTAAQDLHANTPKLRQMLALAKTISYNHDQRSLHFFFVDRATAQWLQTTRVPYRKMIFRLSNEHAQEKGSVWQRQLGRDGTRLETQRQYAIDIQNVTRFTRLTAFLHAHIAAAFDMDDMDICTPEPWTSTVWRMTMKTAECPAFLRGIVRIVWFGWSLVLMHPNMQKRMQCLRCGNLGHPIARCSYTDAQLRGPGSPVASDQEVAKLEDLAKPFASMAEIKEAATKWLALQAEHDKQEQAALMPQSEKGDNAHQPETGPNKAERLPLPAVTAQKQPQVRTVAPSAQQHWVTVPLHHGRKLYAHSAALQDKIKIERSRFADLEERDKAGEE